MVFKVKTLKILTISFVLVSVIHIIYFNGQIRLILFKWNNDAQKSESDPTNDLSADVRVEVSNSLYEMCNPGEDDMLNVHIVMHSHTDPGWLKTLEEYYLGDVQYIFDNVITQLQDDVEKRFIFVEVVFFSIWWKEQSHKMKVAVKNLLEQGRLEFVLGGWTMNDEATTHYSAIIDQHTLGFDFLKENFGEYGVPKTAWQIDTFGHSREQASIFAQFGFDGLFVSRIDYQDYGKRKSSKTLESMWFGSDSLDDRSTLFTGVLNDLTYSSKSDFCFECIPGSHIHEVKEFLSYNTARMSQQLLKDVFHQAKLYSTNHIMWINGGDFQFRNARINFKNVDKLIKYIRKINDQNESRINPFYSTPSCYLYALNKANKTYTSKHDDFFPYADQPERYWTGYYTSRSSLKRSERLLNNVLQICKQLNLFSGNNSQEEIKKKIQYMKETVALIQHHDAISGTSTDHVTSDYKRIMEIAMIKSHEVMHIKLNSLIVNKKKNGTFVNIIFCNLPYFSDCSFTESENQFGVIIYNPFGQKVSSFVKIPIPRNSFHVLDPSSKQIVSQIVPISNTTERIFNQYHCCPKHELVFKADLPAMGYKIYFVKKGVKTDSRSAEFSYVIENKYLRLEFNIETFLLHWITNCEKKIKVQAKQTILYYESQNYDADHKSPPSGAYVFNPHGPLNPIGTGRPQIRFVRGDLVTEVHQTFSEWASQVIRLYKDARHFEIEWTIGPLGLGMEVISSFETSIENNKIFYTDANGRQMMKRVRNYRPTWKYKSHDIIPENYYPVNSRIYIQDRAKDAQMTILTDRSQGGSSLRDGQIELMLHRSTYGEDNLGMRERLNEVDDNGMPVTVRGTHYIYLDTISSSAELHRTMAQRLYMSPYYGFLKLNQSLQEFVKQYNVEWSGLKSQLPKNVHILTLEEWNNGKVLLRLEHYFEKGEDPELSKSSVVSLKDLFLPLKIVSAEERTLGANVRLDKAKRLQWNVEDYGKTPKDMDEFVTPFEQNTMKIILKPMQIRTFIITLG